MHTIYTVCLPPILRNRNGRAWNCMESFRDRLNLNKSDSTGMRVDHRHIWKSFFISLPLFSRISWLSTANNLLHKQIWRRTLVSRDRGSLDQASALTTNNWTNDTTSGYPRNTTRTPDNPYRGLFSRGQVLGFCRFVWILHGFWSSLLIFGRNVQTSELAQ